MGYWIAILFAVASSVIAQTCQYGDSCHARSLSSHELPSSGFVQTWVMHPTDVSVASELSMLRILSRRGDSVQNTPFCTHITIENQPSPNTSPLVGPNLFSLMPDLYNDHFAWSNGHEFISFINHEVNPRTPGVRTGNWLVGNNPGVDSGYVYRTVNMSSISPVSNLDKDNMDTEYSWQWLLHQKWAPQPQMSIVCTSKPTSSNNRQSSKKLANVENVASFASFEVEFFNVENNGDEDLHTGLLFSALPASLHDQLFPEYPSKSVSKSQLSSSDSEYYYLWDKQERRFHLLKVVYVLAGVGRPVLISSEATSNNNANSRKLADEYEEDEAFFAGSSIISPGKEDTQPAKKQPSTSQRDDMGILVGAELAGSKSWRLFFHLFPHDTPSWQPMTPLGNTSSSTSTSTSSLSAQATEKNVHHPIRTEGYYRVDEIYVEMNHQGRSKSGHMLRHAPATSDGLHPNTAVRSWQERRQSETDMLLYATQRGDYLWVWESGSPSGEITEVLVKCTQRVVDVSRGVVSLSFQSFAAHRQVLMTQSMARRVTEHYILTIPLAAEMTKEAEAEAEEKDEYDDSNLETDGFPVTFHSYGGVAGQSRTPGTVSPRHWSSIVFLSHNPATFLIHHLRYKEHQVGHLLSSCFLYHAAVSLPAPLVYAAEILCVLLGSKPVTMIQLSSPSEHQWKFPLVEELSRAIVETSSMYNRLHQSTADISQEDTDHAALNGSFPIDHTVFAYGDDETLLIYRKNREYLMESLLPQFSAQALHPMPYPNLHTHNPDALRKAYYDQLYNAAWNGFTLGYPAYFVRSYVESFHDNQITDRMERQRIFETAARDFSVHLPRVSRGGLSKRGYEMGYGMDDDLFRDLVPVTYLKGQKLDSNVNDRSKKLKKFKNKKRHTGDTSATEMEVDQQERRQRKTQEREWMRHLWERLNQVPM